MGANTPAVATSLNALRAWECGLRQHDIAKLTLCKVDAQNRKHRAQKGAHRAQLVLPFHLVQGRASNSKNLALDEDLSDFGSCQLEGSPDTILKGKSVCRLP